VTPHQSARHLPPYITNSKASPDGGVVLEPTDGVYSQLTTSNIFINHSHTQTPATPSRLLAPDAFPTLPSRLANIRIRRANNGSALLQSPARAGHAARMRQIFEDAGRDHQSLLHEQGVFYPKLPNVSRKASPPPEHNRDGLHSTPTSSAVRRPESSCMPTSSFRIESHEPQVNSLRVSEQSSESWSDDSGYFIAGPRKRISNLTGPPQDRISDWLTSVSAQEQEICIIEDVLDRQSTSHPSPRSSPSRLSENNISNNNTPKSPHQFTTTTIQDPFLETDSSLRTSPLFKALPPQRLSVHQHTPNQAPTQTHSTATITIRSHQPSAKLSILKDGGIQLSPLSPNVCIERGPSRYHSGRTSPVKERRALRYNVNENENEKGGIRLDMAKGSEQVKAVTQGSTLAPCKIGVGTRFQHARHSVRGGMGRFGRGLDE
jgi:hypothetical protein